MHATLAIAAAITAGGAPALAQPPSAPRERLEPDHEMMTLARRIPGFGGLFITNQTQDGRPVAFLPVEVTVYLRSLADSTVARAVITENFTHPPFGDRPRPISSFRFEQATYTFEQLREWKTRLWMNGPSEAIVFVATFLRPPRVVVGARGTKGVAAVRSALAKLGVPADAVEIESAEVVIPGGTSLALLPHRLSEPGPRRRN